MDSITVNHFCNEYVSKIKWRIDDFSIKTSNDGQNRCLESYPFRLYKSRMIFQMVFQQNNENELSIDLTPLDLDSEKLVDLALKFYIEDSMGNCVKDYPGL